MGHTAPLRQLFSSLSDRRFFFVQPGGNWGDYLIYLGAEHLASELGLDWRSMDLDAFDPATVAPGDVIFVLGSGGFNNKASGRAARALSAALQAPDAIVIQGPCTVDTAEDMATLRAPFEASKAQSLTFIAREPRTADLAAPVLPASAQLLLNDDTAFYATRELLLARAKPASRIATLFAVREDPEAVDIAGSVGWRDAVLDPAKYALSFDHWLRIHGAAQRIVANRTHSAICGAILGTPTTMFAGAYHKNRSIWEFSLRDRNVDWLEDHSAIPRRPQIDPLLRWAPGLVQRSWKAARFANRLRGVPTA